MKINFKFLIRQFLSSSVLITTFILLISFTSGAATDFIFQPMERNDSRFPLLGKWRSLTTDYSNQAEYNYEFEFKEDSVTITGICHFYFTVSNLETRIKLQSRHFYPEEQTFQILENKQQSTTDGYNYCQINMTPSMWSFEKIDAHHAVIYTLPPYNLKFELKRK